MRVPEQALYGTWRCRQMKLGGMTGYAVFSWFTCRISKVNGGIWFEKQRHPAHGGLSLSRRKACGFIWARRAPRANRCIAIPAMPRPSAREANPDDQIGVLVGIGNNHLRIDLPLPEHRNRISTRLSWSANLAE